MEKNNGKKVTMYEVYNYTTNNEVTLTKDYDQALRDYQLCLDNNKEKNEYELSKNEVFFNNGSFEKMELIQVLLNSEEQK